MASWRERAVRAMKRADNLKKKGEVALGHMIEIGTVGAVCGGLGYARGRLSDPATEKDDFALASVPAELWVAAGFGLPGAAGLFGKYSAIGVHIGAAGTGQYLGLQGLTMGAKARAESGKAALLVQTKRRQINQGGVRTAAHPRSSAAVR